MQGFQSHCEKLFHRLNFNLHGAHRVFWVSPMPAMLAAPTLENQSVLIASRLETGSFPGPPASRKQWPNLHATLNILLAPRPHVNACGYAC